MSLAMNLSGESSPLCLMSLWVVKEGEIAFVVSMPLCITGSGIFLRSILSMHRTKNMPRVYLATIQKLKLQQKLPSTNPFGNKAWKCNTAIFREIGFWYVTNPGPNSRYYSHSNQGMRRLKSWDRFEKFSRGWGGNSLQYISITKQEDTLCHTPFTGFWLKNDSKNHLWALGCIHLRSEIAFRAKIFGTEFCQQLSQKNLV